MPPKWITSGTAGPGRGAAGSSPAGPPAIFKPAVALAVPDDQGGPQLPSRGKPPAPQLAGPGRSAPGRRRQRATQPVMRPAD